MRASLNVNARYGPINPVNGAVVAGIVNAWSGVQAGVRVSEVGRFVRLGLMLAAVVIEVCRLNEEDAVRRQNGDVERIAADVIWISAIGCIKRHDGSSSIKGLFFGIRLPGAGCRATEGVLDEEI